MNPAVFTALTGPVGWVTAGIIALAAGAVFCYNKFEGFRAVCQGLWAVIKAGGAYIAALGNAFIDNLSALGNWLTQYFRDAGDTMTIWAENRQNNAEMSIAGSKTNRRARNRQRREEQIKAAAGVNIDGSHAMGLNYVPFDGYIAELHQGERVQTRREADLFRQGNFRQTNSPPSEGRLQAGAANITVEYKPVINAQGSMTEKEQENFMRLLRAHKDEVVRLVQSALARQEARSY